MERARGRPQDRSRKMGIIIFALEGWHIALEKQCRSLHPRSLHQGRRSIADVGSDQYCVFPGSSRYQDWRCLKVIDRANLCTPRTRIIIRKNSVKGPKPADFNSMALISEFLCKATLLLLRGWQKNRVGGDADVWEIEVEGEEGILDCLDSPSITNIDEIFWKKNQIQTPNWTHASHTS